MLERSSLATINDLLHAAIACAVLIVSTLSLTEELGGWNGEEVLTVAAAAITGASAAYGATLTPPGMHCQRVASIAAL